MNIQHIKEGTVIRHRGRYFAAIEISEVTNEAAKIMCIDYTGALCNLHCEFKSDGEINSLYFTPIHENVLNLYTKLRRLIVKQTDEIVAQLN